MGRKERDAPVWGVDPRVEDHPPLVGLSAAGSRLIFDSEIGQRLRTALPMPSSSVMDAAIFSSGSLQTS